MPKTVAVSYSQPLDPRTSDGDMEREFEIEIARATQHHVCSHANCLKVMKGRTVCKRRAPFSIAEEDWVDSEGCWGPRQLCAYINNFNPPLTRTLRLLRANHDSKLIMSGVETNVLTWYITTYASKKQQRSSNVLALLAQRVAFHTVQERRQTDLVNINKRLIQRCANTLARDREFSGPEIMSYLMGWGDRFESHVYVGISADAIMGALKDQYPGLRPPAVFCLTVEMDVSQTGSTGAVSSPTGGAASDDRHQIITMVSGVISLKDHLHEYTFRGEELSQMSLLTFMLDTYDTKADTGDTSTARLPETGLLARPTLGRRPNQ